MEFEKGRYLKPDELTKILGVSERVLSRWRNEGVKNTIPFVKLGKFVLYDKVDVLEYLETQKKY